MNRKRNGWAGAAPLILMIVVGVLLVVLLSGCAYTTVDLAYTDPNGKAVQISYTSTKDITVDVVRDAEGNLQQLHVGGAASPVIGAQADYTQSLAAGIGTGVAAGLKAAAVP